MRPATASDDELLASRELGSFAVFYRRHVEGVLAFFARRTRDAELAADLTAETFAGALVARGRFDPGRGSAPAWLYGIALHKLAHARRRRAARAPPARDGADRADRRRHRADRRAGIRHARVHAGRAARARAARR